MTRQVLTPKPYYGRWFRWLLAGYAAIALVSVVFFLPRAPWQAVVYLAVATIGVVGMVRDRFVAYDDVASLRVDPPGGDRPVHLRLADGGRLTSWLLSDDDTEVVVRAYRRSRRDGG